MSDPLERDGDPLFAAAAEFGRTHLGWREDAADTVPTPKLQPTFDAQIEMASKLIDDADEVMDDWRGNSDPNGEALVAATQAVALATITLAQQQRVANMIAFGQATGTSYRTEIRKALGLS